MFTITTSNNIYYVVDLDLSLEVLKSENLEDCEEFISLMDEDDS